MIIADAAIKFIIDPMDLDTYSIIPHNESLVPNNDMCQQINAEEALWISHYIRLSLHKMLSNRQTTQKSDYTKNKNLNDKTKLMLIILDALLNLQETDL